jgi:hypothetical protein
VIRPRHYARDICKMATREERAAALERVPENYRDMVKLHVTITFAINKSKRENNAQNKIRDREPQGTLGLL